MFRPVVFRVRVGVLLFQRGPEQRHRLFKVHRLEEDGGAEAQGDGQRFQGLEADTVRASLQHMVDFSKWRTSLLPSSPSPWKNRFWNAFPRLKSDSHTHSSEDFREMTHWKRWQKKYGCNGNASL